MDTGFSSLGNPNDLDNPDGDDRRRQRKRDKKETKKGGTDGPSSPVLQPTAPPPSTVNPLSKAARERTAWVPPGGNIPVAYSSPSPARSEPSSISRHDSEMIPLTVAKAAHANQPGDERDAALEMSKNSGAAAPMITIDKGTPVSNTAISKNSSDWREASNLELGESANTAATREQNLQEQVQQRQQQGSPHITAGLLPLGSPTGGSHPPPITSASTQAPLAATAGTTSVTFADDDNSQSGGTTTGLSIGKNSEPSTASNEATMPPPPPPEKLNDRIASCISRFADENGMVEVHTVKRLMHSCKLTQAQKTFVLPSHVAQLKRVSQNVCVRSLQRVALTAPTVVEEIISKLNTVPDSFILNTTSIMNPGGKGAAVGSAGGGGGIMAAVEDRLRTLMSDTHASLADNEVRRAWDSLHLFSIFYFYAVSMVQNVMYREYDYDISEPPTRHSWRFITFVLCHCFWTLDIILTTQMFTTDGEGRLVKKFREIVVARKWVLIIDILGLLPVDFALQASGNWVPFLVFRLIKYLKLLRVNYLYEIVNRDIITPSTVTFFFQYKPIVIGMFWLCSFIHACAVAHNLIDQFEIRPRKYEEYTLSLVAVCVMLSGSNANVDVWVTADKLLCVPLSILSLFGQGVLVGKLTALVFRNSVSAENYQLMRDTLSIVRHYKVPNSIQREVLSYQMHSLNDDVARHMRNLETLPQQMQHEIMLYIKIDAVSKVKMFTSASEKCKMTLAASLKRVVVEPEVEVVRFGDIGDQMFMMAHGYADVILGTGKIVTTFTRGDCFGEMALVQKSSTRTATVRALTYCDMWTLDKKSFLHALALFPDFQKGVEEELIKRKGNVDELREAVTATQALMHSAGDDGTPSSSPLTPGPLQTRGEVAGVVQDVDVGLQRGLVRRESLMPTTTAGSGRGARASIFAANPVLPRRSSVRLSVFGDGTIETATTGGAGGLSSGSAQPVTLAGALRRTSSAGGRAGSLLPPGVAPALVSGAPAAPMPAATQGILDLRNRIGRKNPEYDAVERDIQSIRKQLLETKKRSLEMQRQLEMSAPLLNKTGSPMVASASEQLESRKASAGQQ